MVLTSYLLASSLARDIWLMGEGYLIASFLDEQAIDSSSSVWVPVFIGDGIPLIARCHRHVPLDLQSVERFEDGVVQLPLPRSETFLMRNQIGVRPAISAILET
jgi:dihydrofolate reductase